MSDNDYAIGGRLPAAGRLILWYIRHVSRFEDGYPPTVLIADDNRDSADVLALSLQAAGYQTSVAYSGEAAVRIADEMHPAAVIIDLGMPIMNGFEVAASLRARSWGRESLLVALTGWCRPDDRSRARTAGFDEYVTKPSAGDVIEGLLAGRFATSPAAG